MGKGRGGGGGKFTRREVLADGVQFRYRGPRVRERLAAERGTARETSSKQRARRGGGHVGAHLGGCELIGEAERRGGQREERRSAAADEHEQDVPLPRLLREMQHALRASLRRRVWQVTRCPCVELRRRRAGQMGCGVHRCVLPAASVALRANRERPTSDARRLPPLRYCSTSGDGCATTTPFLKAFPRLLSAANAIRRLACAQ